MAEIRLFRMIFFLMAFLIEISFVGSMEMTLKVYNWTEKKIHVACCGQTIGDVSENSNGDFRFYVRDDFFQSQCVMDLTSSWHKPLRKMEITQPYTYSIDFIQSFKTIRIFYAKPTQGTKWQLTVHTIKDTNYNGRFYFVINCDSTRDLIPLANSYENFTFNRTDVFIFEAKPFDNDNFCVQILRTLSNDWVFSSLTLTNLDNFSNYTFYRGQERSEPYHMYGYAGNDPVDWTVELTTGTSGAVNKTVQIVLDDGNCQTKLTLDTENVDFSSGSTDVFHVQAKRCPKLKNVTLICGWGTCNWMLNKMKLTREDGVTYLFNYNKIIQTQQSFFAIEADGTNEWDLTFCTYSAIDDLVMITLFTLYKRNSKVKTISRQSDGFLANQCKIFTLFLSENLNELWMIHMNKPSKAQINKVTLTNKGKVYEFFPSQSQSKFCKMVYYKPGIWIFAPNINNAVAIEESCARSCMYNSSCRQFYIENNACKVSNDSKGNRLFSYRPDITVWILHIQFPSITIVNEIRVVIRDKTDRFISYHQGSSPNTENITATFSSQEKGVQSVTVVNLEIVPPINDCTGLKLNLRYITAIKQHELFFNKTSCKWFFTNSEVNEPETNPPPDVTTDFNPTTIETTNLNPTTEEASSSASTTAVFNFSASSPDTSSSTDSDTSSPTDTKSHHTTNTVKTTTDKPSLCKCPCYKNLSQAEKAEQMKKLVKELKVNRNETTSYLRSKTSAPDARVSSQVIGSTAVIIMAVPFGLIILVDLIPLLSFIYKKAISYL